MYLTIQGVIMMVGIVVDIMWTPIGALYVHVTKIWTVQLHLIWLAMVYAMTNPTPQIVALMEGTVVDLAPTESIVMNVHAMQDRQLM